MTLRLIDNCQLGEPSVAVWGPGGLLVRCYDDMLENSLSNCKCLHRNYLSENQVYLVMSV